MKPISVLLIISFVLLHITCCSQENRLKSELLTTEHGLSSNIVYTIFQDTKGYVWVGTNDGLNRYDGYAFRKFRHSSSDSNALCNNTVYDVCEDAEGNIWIATAGGVSQYNYKADKITTVYHTRGDTTVWQVIPVNNHELLMAQGAEFCVKDFFIADIRTLHMKHIGFEEEDGGISCQIIYEPPLVKDKQGNIFAAQDKDGIIKIWRYDNRSRCFIAHDSITLDTKPASQSLYWFYPDSHGRIWLGFVNSISCFQKQGETGRPYIFREKNTETVRRIFEDSRGNIWIGTRNNGLYLWNNSAKKLEHYRNEQAGFLSSNILSAICEDHSGIIWLGGFNGLNKRHPQPAGFRHIPGNELANSAVMGIYPGKNNTVNIHYIFGTHRISTLDPATHRVKHYYPQNLGSLAEHALRYLKNPNSLHDSTLKRLLSLPLTRYIIRSYRDGDVMMLVDDRQNIWFRQGRYVCLVGTNKIWNIDTYTIDMEAKGGKVWVATVKGLWCIDIATQEMIRFFADPANISSLSSDNVTSLIIEENGDVWVGTKEGGLNYFDSREKSFTAFTEKQGLCDNSIYCMVKDDRGRIWLGTGSGLSCFNPVTRSFKNYSRADGLINTEYNRYSALKLAAGEIYIGGMNGIDYFNPADIDPEEEKPHVQITNFEVFNKPVYPHGRYALKYNENYVSISFAVMDFSDPSKNKFSYMLEGVDKEWTGPDEQNRASYPTLPPGKYRFFVKGANSHGVWSEPEAVEFSISVPWWNSWWFYSSCIIAMSLAFYGFYSYRINQLRKIYRMRNKISRDLHDEIGTTLSGIGLYVEMAKEQLARNKDKEAKKSLEVISENAKAMIGTMSDIVWTVNPRHDTLDKVLSKLEAFAREVTTPKNIRLHVEHDTGTQTINMQMPARRNIYLICKEAITNAVKYSGCENLYFRFLKSGTHYNIIIEDDGKGFDVAGESSGNGLYNMVNRAKEIKAHVTISSGGDKGTTVRVDFKNYE